MARRKTNPLLAWRKAKTLSQAEAGDRVGITKQMWSYLERGKAFASPRLARLIEAETGIDRDVLMNYGDNVLTAPGSNRSAN